MNIKAINIKGLFGDRDYKITLKNNRLILVAENGSGKTTIVNIIYYFLSGQWPKLIKYDFTSIEVDVGTEKLKLNKSEIDLSSSARFKRILKRYPPKVQETFSRVLRTFDATDLNVSRLNMQYLMERYDLPRSLVYELVTAAEKEQFTLFESALSDKRRIMSEIMDAQILYLPTYRRIEQDLRTILPDLDDELSKYRNRRSHKSRRRLDESTYIELVEFGMEDVELKINYRLKEIETEFNDDLKNGLTGTYLKDILNESYKQINFENLKIFDQTSLNSILSRIKSTVLSDQEKERLSLFVSEMNSTKFEKAENKIVAYFIYRLSEIYDSLQKKEIDILKFVKVCNSYSRNKIYHYDNINFTIDIFPVDRNGDPIENKKVQLKDLSSGEKQIVSLFSHLFLSDVKKFFVIIDEPELSLSVPWQQKFLEDISQNEFCDGIIAVTHSPFIFDNALDKYAQGLNIFER